MASIAEVAARIHRHLATHDGDGGHGYDWGSRWGDGTTESIVVDGVEYRFPGGDYDCSSSVITAYKAAGLGVDATYTGDMVDGFLATGMFEAMPMSHVAQRGDIYLNVANHTAMCQSAVPDLLTEFCINELGGCYGGRVGDQTGGESREAAWYDYPWDLILRFTGGEASAGWYVEPHPERAPSVRYAASNDPQGGAWLPFVTDLEDYAGIPGRAIRWLAVDMGGHGWYQVCTADNGWLPRVRRCDTSDLEAGCAGDGSPVMAVRVYYETPDPASTGYFSARYRVSDVSREYWPWQHDDDTWNGQDGYAGDMAPIDRFQLSLVA